MLEKHIDRWSWRNISFLPDTLIEVNKWVRDLQKRGNLWKKSYLNISIFEAMCGAWPWNANNINKSGYYHTCGLAFKLSVVIPTKAPCWLMYHILSTKSVASKFDKSLLMMMWSRHSGLQKTKLVVNETRAICKSCILILYQYGSLIYSFTTIDQNDNHSC